MERIVAAVSHTQDISDGPFLDSSSEQPPCTTAARLWNIVLLKELVSQFWNVNGNLKSISKSRRRSWQCHRVILYGVGMQLTVTAHYLGWQALSTECVLGLEELGNAQKLISCKETMEVMKNHLL